MYLTMYLFKKIYFIVLSDPGQDTERPFNLKKFMIYMHIMSEDHKMTKQDKLVYTITMCAIFFGVFFIGLVGLIISIF